MSTIQVVMDGKTVELQVAGSADEAQVLVASAAGELLPMTLSGDIEIAADGTITVSDSFKEESAHPAVVDRCKVGFCFIPSA